MAISAKDKCAKKSISKEKIHAWRLCPKGYHFVRSHSLYIPPSKSHPGGQRVTRHGHCAKNPHGKDILTFDEIAEISSQYIRPGKSKITLGILKEFPNSGKYDAEIIGWIQYWNDIFKVKERLDPNLLKALMATESGFNKDTLNQTKSNSLGKAHGLMQIIDQTHKALSDHKGELKDHLIMLNEDELTDPSANICAAIRWLFQKKVTAKARLGRDVSWLEAIAEYKGLLSDYNNDEKNAVRIMNKLINYYIRLKS